MRKFPKPYNADTKERILSMIIEDVRKIVGPGDAKKNNLVALYKEGKYDAVLDNIGECFELIGFGTALMYLSLAQFDDEKIKEFDIVCQNVFYWSEKLSVTLAKNVDFAGVDKDMKDKLVLAITGKSDSDPDTAPDLSVAEIYVQYPAPEIMFA